MLHGKGLPHRLPPSLAPVHSLDVVLVVSLELLPLKLEGVGHQASLRGPWLGA